MKITNILNKLRAEGGNKPSSILMPVDALEEAEELESRIRELVDALEKIAYDNYRPPTNDYARGYRDARDYCKLIALAVLMEIKP